MSFDLTNKNISDTFQNLLQRTGSEGHLYDLVGNQVQNLTIAGSLTANQYITSQSIVYTSSGSTAFGNTSDDTHVFIGNISAQDGIVLGGYLRTSWPSAGSVGDWYDTGTNAQTSSKDVIVDGFISASSLEVDSVDPTEDFFLLKSGSLNALKLNNEGVLQLGSFTFTPTAVSGGIYYNDVDNEFYLGKKDS
jgi:hypothetical protein